MIIRAGVILSLTVATRPPHHQTHETRASGVRAPLATSRGSVLRGSYDRARRRRTARSGHRLAAPQAADYPTFSRTVALPYRLECPRVQRPLGLAATRRHRPPGRTRLGHRPPTRDTTAWGPAAKV